MLSAVSQITSALETQKFPKHDDDDDAIKDEDSGHPTLSKKKLRKLNRLTVAELKQLVTRPDVVEMHDVTARDPKLLICLKSAKHSVPVPRHWNAKRKYLAGKRGFQKAPFDLPEFIKRTGIMEMRSALQEKVCCCVQLLIRKKESISLLKYASETYSPLSVRCKSSPAI